MKPNEQLPDVPEILVLSYMHRLGKHGYEAEHIRANYLPNTSLINPDPALRRSQNFGIRDRYHITPRQLTAGAGILRRHDQCDRPLVGADGA